MKNSILTKLIFSLLLIGIFVSPATTAPHRFHTSFTRMDYNETDKLIEVTIRLFTHDFEKVFKNLTNTKNNPESLENIDEIILKYLNEHFVFTGKKDLQKKLVWVGKEFNADTLYVFVEIPFEGEFNDLKIKDTIFFESFPEQINYVSARLNDKKSDLVFKVGDDFKNLEFRTEKEK